MKESGFPRYLHSAVLLSGTLLVFGGNTHNDTSLSNGAKCFSADFLSYDIGNTWRQSCGLVRILINSLLKEYSSLHVVVKIQRKNYKVY